MIHTKNGIALALAGLLMAVSAALGIGQAQAEPDINCGGGDFTGRDTSSPGFVRTYPQACVDKFLGLVHADSFTAPGGDVELVTLGKTACHSLDLDRLNGDTPGAKAIDAAEAKLTFAFTDEAKQIRDPGREVGLARDKESVPMKVNVNITLDIDPEREVEHDE